MYVCVCCIVMGSNCICCGAAAADGIGSRGECFLANGVGEAVKEEQISQRKILQVVLVSPQVLQTSSFFIFLWLTDYFTITYEPGNFLFD